MNLPQYLKLNNGTEIPAVGLGTFQGDEGNYKVKKAVKLALQLGYRHIDGATAYGNERDIGQAIRESGLPRQEIFETLADLQLDYVPHAYRADEQHNTIRHPSGNGKPLIDYELSRNYAATWKAMEALVDRGKARSIGPSNFNLIKTKKLLETARIIPAVNQVELDPYLPQHELVKFSQAKGITIMAHQPLGGRPVGVVRAHPDMPPPTEDSVIVQVATQLGKSPAQVCLSWAVQKGIPVIPKSVQEVHMKHNLELFRLAEDNFRAIDELSLTLGPIRFLNPLPHIGFDIFDEENDQPVDNKAPWD
ncbi:aldo-keto reductase [Biscogniauxia marginata]|nr:aldo-keto reductase [Biscogniauxia marginata]